MLLESTKILKLALISFSKSSTSVKYLMLFHIDRVTKYTTMINQHSADRKNDLVALHSS